MAQNDVASPDRGAGVQCLFLAQSRHRGGVLQCPLSGVKRTSTGANQMSAFDPKRTFVMSVAAPRNALRKQERQTLSTPDAFATWVEIASISAGERQSYASNPNSFSRARTAGISLGGVPDSMIEETNAANQGVTIPARLKAPCGQNQTHETDVLRSRCDRTYERHSPCKRTVGWQHWYRRSLACRHF